LADHDTHRVPIINDQKVGMPLLMFVTQMDMARWLYSKLSQQRDIILPDAISAMTVKDLLRTKSGVKPLITVLATDPLIKAFRLIHQHKVMGVAVVDPESGKLVTNISANDLRKLPSYEFKQFLNELFTPVSLYRNPSRLIIAKASDKLVDVLGRMVNDRVHRVWIVDEQQKPVGVLSICDIISQFSDLPQYFV